MVKQEWTDKNARCDFFLGIKVILTTTLTTKCNTESKINKSKSTVIYWLDCFGGVCWNLMLMTWQTCGSNRQTRTWQLIWQKLTMWQLVEQPLTGVSMTCRMTWLQEVDVVDDMAGLIIFSAGFFSSSFFLASLASVTRCRRCWLTPCSCLGQRREGKRWRCLVSLLGGAVDPVSLLGGGCCRRWGRCGWWVAAGAVAGVRLTALMVSNAGTDDWDLRWLWRCRFVEGSNSAWSAIDGCGRRWCGVADCSVELMCRSSWWRAAADACLGRRCWGVDEDSDDEQWWWADLGFGGYWGCLNCSLVRMKLVDAWIRCDGCCG